MFLWNPLRAVWYRYSNYLLIYKVGLIEYIFNLYLRCIQKNLSIHLYTIIYVYIHTYIKVGRSIEVSRWSSRYLSCFNPSHYFVTIDSLDLGTINSFVYNVAYYLQPILTLSLSLSAYIKENRLDLCIYVYLLIGKLKTWLGYITLDVSTYTV